MPEQVAPEDDEKAREEISRAYLFLQLLFHQPNEQDLLQPYNHLF